MNLLDLFKEAINEHASAQIQKERIQLFKEQYEILQKKTDVLEKRVAELMAERDIFLKDIASRDIKIMELIEVNADLKLINDRLNEGYKAEDKCSQTHDAPLEKQKLDILLLLKENPAMNLEELAEASGRNKAAIRFDSEELEETGFIDFERAFGFEYLTLAKPGRKYLKDCGLLE